MFKSCQRKGCVFSLKTRVLIFGVLSLLCLTYSMFYLRKFVFLNPKFERETFSQRNAIMNFENSKRGSKASFYFSSRTRKNGVKIGQPNLSRKGK